MTVSVPDWIAPVGMWAALGLSVLAAVTGIIIARRGRTPTAGEFFLMTVGIFAAAAGTLSSVVSNQISEREGRAFKFVLGAQKERISKAELKSAQAAERAASAQERAAIANERIAEANIKAMRIKQKLSAAQIDLDRTRDALAGRRVKSVQLDKLKLLLKGNGGGEFLIVYPNDDESRNFAVSMRSALAGIGADVALKEGEESKYFADYSDFSATISPPLEEYVLSEESPSIDHIIYKDRYISALMKAGIVEALGEPGEQDRYGYTIVIHPRNFLKNGTLDRSSYRD